MNTVHQELLQVEAALEAWREERGWHAVGCGHAERMAFEAGYQAALRAIDQAAQARYLVPQHG